MVKRITPTDVISTGSKKRKLTKEDSKKSKDSSSDSDDDNKKKKVKDKEKDKKKEKDEKGEKKKDKKKDKKKKKQALSSSDDDDDDETSKAAKAIAKKSKTPGQIVSIIHAPDTWEGQGDMSYREVTVEPGPKEYAFVAKPSEASVAAKHINDSSGHKYQIRRRSNLGVSCDFGRDTPRNKIQRKRRRTEPPIYFAPPTLCAGGVYHSVTGESMANGGNISPTNAFKIQLSFIKSP